jgi:hypothetical protein
MIRSLFMLTTFLVLSCTSYARAQMTIYSYANDKNYRTEVTREALQASPTWKNDAENPPLSALNARHLADEARARLVKNTVHFTWRLESIELTPTSVEGKWFWLARYGRQFNGNSEGQYPFLKVVVLMDGTVTEQTSFKNRD